jgi:tRNA-intron endonuclease
MELRRFVEKSLQEAEFQGDPIKATIRKGRITVDDTDRSSELEQLGYGEKEAKHHVLKDHEALYLIFTKKMNLKDEKGGEVKFDQLAEDAQRRAGDSWSRFIIYRDLRSRGYVAKDGFGFGTDLRVYDRGDFPRKAAKYVVFVLDEGAETSVDDLRDSVRQITKMGKEAIVAVVERRGEVIYYKVSRTNFNK